MALKAPETDAGPGPSTKGHLWKNRVARAKREFELLQQILRKPFDQRTHEDRMAVLKQMSVCQSLGDVSEAGKLKLAGVVGKDSRALLSAFACASSAVLKRWYKQALRSTPPVSQSSWLASTHLRIGTSVPALRLCRGVGRGRTGLGWTHGRVEYSRDYDGSAGTASSTSLYSKARSTSSSRRSWSRRSSPA